MVIRRQPLLASIHCSVSLFVKQSWERAGCENSFVRKTTLAFLPSCHGRPAQATIPPWKIAVRNLPFLTPLLTHSGFPWSRFISRNAVVDSFGVSAHLHKRAQVASKRNLQNEVIGVKFGNFRLLRSGRCVNWNHTHVFVLVCTGRRRTAAQPNPPTALPPPNNTPKTVLTLSSVFTHTHTHTVLHMEALCASLEKSILDDLGSPIQKKRHYEGRIALRDSLALRSCLLNSRIASFCWEKYVFGDQK